MYPLITTAHCYKNTLFHFGPHCPPLFLEKYTRSPMTLTALHNRDGEVVGKLPLKTYTLYFFLRTIREFQKKELNQFIHTGVSNGIA